MKEIEITKKEKVNYHKVKTEDLKGWAEIKIKELIYEFEREDCTMLCIYTVGKKGQIIYSSQPSDDDTISLLYDAMRADDRLRMAVASAQNYITWDEVEKQSKPFKADDINWEEVERKMKTLKQDKYGNVIE